MNTRTHLLILLLLILGSWRSSEAEPGGEATFVERYEATLESFRRGDYGEAQAGFQQLLGAPDLRSDYQDNCYFWIGECQYARRDYLDALASFSKVLEFPWPSKEIDARMKIALCWFNLGERARACLEADALVARDPEGPFAVRARRLAELACSDAQN
jgi:TolA-binding protein